MSGHTTNRAEMHKARVMQKATRKTGSANGRTGPFLRTAKPRFCTWLSGAIDEKNFENLPRVFLRRKPGANHQKTKPTEVNRKDAHAALNHE